MDINNNNNSDSNSSNNNNNNINANKAIYYDNGTAVPIQTNDHPNHMINYTPRPISYSNIQHMDHEQALFPFMYGHDKWPHKVEKAFTEALRLIMKSGTSKIKVRNKNYGRNELISLYIRYETGEIRTKKQISSHIQTKESLERFYATFEVIIDALAKEESMNNFQINTYSGVNPPITKVYPQPYQGGPPYSNHFKNIVPTIVGPSMVDSSMHRMAGYQYQPNYNTYQQQQPILISQVNRQGYSQIDNYQMPQSDPSMHYNVTNSNSVTYQRVYPDYYNQPSHPSGERLGQANNNPNQVSNGFRNWIPSGQQIPGGLRDSNSRIPPMNYPPQYLNDQAFPRSQNSANQTLHELDSSNTGTYTQVTPTLTESDRVNLRPPIQNSSLNENRFRQVGGIYSENEQPHNYIAPVNQDFKAQPSVVTIQPIRPVKEINNANAAGNMSTVCLDSRYTGNATRGEHNTMKAANDALPYGEGRTIQNAPFLYKDTSVQQGSPTVAGKQPLVMLPSYPYYSKATGASTVKNDGKE
ncbi:hypothetical protein C6P45_002267 [Maudiozyma exigua]|uniref:TEA domain-containing protein n=1 Tax=Maudiozyma exigua TaxID=34358 RepID=A0A9P7BCS7_MAUEX|nr:hypothetical protein C6P45_002267 [Kazachstania exigua]